MTNFRQEAIGIVTGGLLLISVLVPNAGEFARCGRELLRRRQPRALSLDVKSP